MEPPFLIVRADDGRSVRLALPIGEFFELEDAARALMARALSGDQQAGKQVETIFALADDPNSNEQPRAFVSTFCLHKAMQEIQAQRAAWAQQQTQPVQPTPQPQARPGPPQGPPGEVTQAPNAIPSRRRAPPAPPVPADEMASCPHGLALDLPCPSCVAAVRAEPPAAVAGAPR